MSISNQWTKRAIFSESGTPMLVDKKSEEKIIKNLGSRIAVVMKQSVRTNTLLGVDSLTLALNGWRWAAANLENGDDSMTALHNSVVVSEKLARANEIMPPRTVLGKPVRS